MQQKRTKTQYPYKLQKLSVLYNYKKVKSIISKIIRAFKIIQIYNILYSKKRLTQNRYTKKKKIII